MWPFPATLIPPLISLVTFYDSSPALWFRNALSWFSSSLKNCPSCARGVLNPGLVVSFLLNMGYNQSSSRRLNLWRSLRYFSSLWWILKPQCLINAARLLWAEEHWEHGDFPLKVVLLPSQNGSCRLGFCVAASQAVPVTWHPRGLSSPTIFIWSHPLPWACWS